MRMCEVSLPGVHLIPLFSKLKLTMHSFCDALRSPTRLSRSTRLRITAMEILKVGIRKFVRDDEEDDHFVGFDKLKPDSTTVALLKDKRSEWEIMIIYARALNELILTPELSLFASLIAV